LIEEKPFKYLEGKFLTHLHSDGEVICIQKVIEVREFQINGIALFLSTNSMIPAGFSTQPNARERMRESKMEEIALFQSFERYNDLRETMESKWAALRAIKEKG
jgi:hypothetical protein